MDGELDRLVRLPELELEEGAGPGLGGNQFLYPFALAVEAQECVPAGDLDADQGVGAERAGIGEALGQIRLTERAGYGGVLPAPERVSGQRRYGRETIDRLRGSLDVCSLFAEPASGTEALQVIRR